MTTTKRQHETDALRAVDAARRSEKLTCSALAKLGGSEVQAFAKRHRLTARSVRLWQIYDRAARIVHRQELLAHGAH
jgi:hypothetical protein